MSDTKQLHQLANTISPPRVPKFKFHLEGLICRPAV